MFVDEDIETTCSKRKKLSIYFKYSMLNVVSTESVKIKYLYKRSFNNKY